MSRRAGRYGTVRSTRQARAKARNICVGIAIVLAAVIVPRWLPHDRSAAISLCPTPSPVLSIEKSASSAGDEDIPYTDERPLDDEAHHRSQEMIQVKIRSDAIKIDLSAYEPVTPADIPFFPSGRKSDRGRISTWQLGSPPTRILHSGNDGYIITSFVGVYKDGIKRRVPYEAYLRLRDSKWHCVGLGVLPARAKKAGPSDVPEPRRRSVISGR